MLNIEKAFKNLKKRNKIAFTLIITFAIVLIWKGFWVLSDILFDEILFSGHIFWGNVAALLVGLGILLAAGVALDRLA
jgi:hypothetical protein